MRSSRTDLASEPDRADGWLTPGRFALILGLLIIVTFPAVLMGGRTFVIRDFGMFSYPVAHFQRQCFWHGELPLWNPFNYCGVPFLAQWNTLALYPPSLVYLLFPLEWGLSFFCLAHLFWGGLGMYFLARRWTGQQMAAGLAGVIFAFNGLSLNFLMWPSHVATFSWLPWVVWIGQRAWLEGGRMLVWGTLAAAMQMLAGGPETIVATWLILLILGCGDWFRQPDLRGRVVCRLVGLGVMVALLCAIQLLPFLELLAHSQRDRNYSASAQDWCMPFWGWANFLVPLFRTAPTAQGVFLQNGQYWTSSYYAAIGTVWLAVIAVWRARDWRAHAAGALVLLGLVLALGDSTLLYRALRLCFPGLGFVRYPVKFVILVLALAPLLAAFGLAALPRKKGGVGGFHLIAALLMLVLIGAIVAWDANSGLAADVWRATWQSGLSRAVFLVLTGAAAIGLLAAQGRGYIALGCLLIALFWLDLVTHAPTQNPCVSPSVYAPGWARAQLKLHPEPTLGTSRAMVSAHALEYLRRNPMPSPEETYRRNRLAIRVNCNLLDELPQIDGFFSLAPHEISRVTALAYDQPCPASAGLLDFLGVSQMTSPGSIVEWVARPTVMPIITAGQQPVFADDRTAFEALCQTNLDLRQTVFLPPEARDTVSATPQATCRVFDARFSYRRVAIQTEARATSMIVVSQTYYPAWKAYVDGSLVRIWRANYAFQALELPGDGTKSNWFTKTTCCLGEQFFPLSGFWCALAYGDSPGIGDPRQPLARTSSISSFGFTSPAEWQTWSN